MSEELPPRLAEFNHQIEKNILRSRFSTRRPSKRQIVAGALVFAGLSGSFMAGRQSGIESEQVARIQQDIDALDKKIQNKKEEIAAQKIEWSIIAGAELKIATIAITEKLHMDGEEWTNAYSYPIVDEADVEKLNLWYNESQDPSKLEAFKFWTAKKSPDGKPLVKAFTFNPATMSIVLKQEPSTSMIHHGVLEKGDPNSQYYKFVSVVGDSSFGPVAAEQILAPNASNA